MIDESAGSEFGGSDLVLLGPRVPGPCRGAGALLGALVEPPFIMNPGNPTAINLPNGWPRSSARSRSGVEEYLAGLVVGAGGRAVAARRLL
mgnify:CR=1 FL=1